MTGRWGATLGIALCVVGGGGSAAALEVRLPPSTAIASPGDSATVVVSIAAPAAQDMVFAGALSVTYAGAVAVATGATPGAALAGCTTATNLTPGRVTLLFACATPLTGGGALFEVGFHGLAIGVSPLAFAPTAEIPGGCLLNEGTPACQAVDGELVVGAPPPTATATPSGAATATATATLATPPATPTATPTGGPQASGRLVQDVYRASDGTVYQLARVLPQAAAGEAAWVTTVVGSVAPVSGCSSAGATAGSPVDAEVGSVAPIPFAAARRSGVLVPIGVAQVSFDPRARGRLRLGTGAGAHTVCASPADCVGEPGVTALVDLAAAGGGLAAACLATGVTTACSGGSPRDAVAFGLAAAGSPPLCDAAPTTATVLCAAPPLDGFRLLAGQAVVFVYDGDLASSAVGVGLAGFDIDVDGSNPAGCDGGVVGATALTESMPAPPPRTTTATPVRTRAPIPAVPSPIGGAGLLMIGGLAAALILALHARASE